MYFFNYFVKADIQYLPINNAVMVHAKTYKIFGEYPYLIYFYDIYL